jgi:outer membrane protein OmpA-like peptidoglycan-associated protein
MKALKAIFLLFVFATGYGQQTPREIVIRGYTFNSNDKTFIPNTPLIIKTDLGDLQQTFSNKDGFYEIRFEAALFKKAEVYTQTNKDLRTPTAPLGFLASEERLKIDIADSAAAKVLFRKDFSLRPVMGCPTFNSVLFKKNSVTFDTVYPTRIDGFYDSAYYLPATSIGEIYKTLKDNPSIVIEISGHSSSDENAGMLSQRRAQKVVDELVKMGINTKRLVAKGYGITKLKITDAQIAKAKTKKEKDMLHAVNRRSVFKILSWDFSDPDAPEPKQEKYHPEMSGEEQE